jgi:hypothetical protein
MSGSFLVQSGGAVGALPAVASKDTSTSERDLPGGFASVLGQEDASTETSKGSAAATGARPGAPRAGALPPNFDPTHAVVAAAKQARADDAKDPPLAPREGSSTASPSDPPPVDLRSDDDRDRHALAAAVLPVFAAPHMPPPAPIGAPAPAQVGSADIATDARGAGMGARRAAPSMSDPSAMAEEADASQKDAASSPELATDAADGAARASAPTRHGSAPPAAAPSAVASPAVASPAATAPAATAPAATNAPAGASASPNTVGGASPATAASAPPVTIDAAATAGQMVPPSGGSPASLAVAQAASASPSPAAGPRPMAVSPRTQAREQANGKSEPQASASNPETPQVSRPSLGAPDVARAQASAARDAQAPAAPRASAARDGVTTPAAGASREGPAASVSRAGDQATSGSERAARSRANAAGTTDGADRTSAQDPHAADPNASPLQSSAAGSQGNVDDGRANTMTAVTKASPSADPSAAATSERLRDALASVSNRAVLRGPATGHIEVPELGRIAVHARSTGGSVDVDVTADRADTRSVLRGHVSGMTADLNQAAVPVARVTVERGAAAFGDSQGSAAGDPGANRQDSSRDQSTSVERDDEPTPADTGTAKRVRIVL